MRQGALELPNRVSTASVQLDSVGRGSKGKFHVLELILLVLLVQVIGLVLVSFVMQTGPVFVGHGPRFAMDFFHLYNAGLCHMNGLNAHGSKWFVMPPSTLLLGVAFQWLPFEDARIIWFLLNLTAIYFALRSFARQIGLGGRSTMLLFLIAGLFYPLYFLLERGNYDGLSWLVSSSLLVCRSGPQRRCCSASPSR